MSKSGSPAARRMTGTPAWKRAVAWSLMATVLEGLTALTRGLSERSTSKSECEEALTAIALGCFAARVLRRVRERNWCVK